MVDVRPRQEAGRCSDSVAVPKPHLRHPFLGSISVVRELELELLLSLGATSTRPVFRRIGFYQRLGKKRLRGSLAVDDIDHDDSTTGSSVLPDERVEAVREKRHAGTDFTGALYHCAQHSHTTCDLPSSSQYY
uniref:Uncharacterized protein n=1 Tax=Oryza glumipatula TaxID=40148 RepID=A0A0D9Z6L5_9ORYZ